MILTFDAFVADGLGPHLPQSAEFEWPAGSDVTLRGTLRHSDGSLYPIVAGMAVLMGWKASDKDTTPLVQRQATVVGGAVFEVYIGAGDVQLGLGPGRFVCDALLGITVGQVTDYEEVLKPSRTNITRTITLAGGPVSVPSFQAPLARGLQGFPNWRGLWDVAIAYAIGDGVDYLDPSAGAPSSRMSSFRCLVANTNVPPVDNAGVLSADWTYVGQCGANGSGTYTPAIPGQWSGPAPGTPQQAIDRLAALLYALTDGTPIP